MPDSDVYQPLAERMRPTILDDYVGQTHLVGENAPLRLCLERKALHSLILWGPPGTGKTTLARLMANHMQAFFQALSAVHAGVKQIKDVIGLAERQRQLGSKTVLFIDEIHRFNKAQQDALLPSVESGLVILIGATTENPSFEVNQALLSRCRVYVLQSLEKRDLVKLLERALEKLDETVQAEEAALELIADYADGDGRSTLNLLELALQIAPINDGSKFLSKDTVKQVLTKSLRHFDKGGEQFYNQISALHKAMRGSDPDAALYWFTRMIDGGCEPRYIARRMTRFASEDIGNADPRALSLCLDAWQAYERLGSPEGELALAQAVVYMAAIPKSNAVYKAYKHALSDVKNDPSYEVPLHLRNAPTKLMKQLDYGKGYRYAHDETDGFAAGENYFPDQKQPINYYKPVERGLEIKIAAKLRELKQRNKKVNA